MLHKGYVWMVSRRNMQEDLFMLDDGTLSFQSEADSMHFMKSRLQMVGVYCWGNDLMVLTRIAD